MAALPGAGPALCLFDRHGGPCTKAGCTTLGRCDGSCLDGWLPCSSAVRAALQRGGFTWLLLLGDSDTRGLALLLLQVLAEAGHGRATAIANASLWMLDVRDPLVEQTRVCHLDAYYDGKGRLLRGDSVFVPCLDSSAPKDGSNGAGSPNETAYALLGRDYQLARGAAARAQLRVTFASHTHPLQLLETLRALDAQLQGPGRPQNQRAAHSAGRWLDQRPDLMYVAAGIWTLPRGAKAPPPEVVLGAVDSFAAAHVGPPHGSGVQRGLVWGTALGHRLQSSTPNTSMAIDDAARRWLPSRGWHVLERGTALSRVPGLSGLRGLRLSSKHAPHLVNLADLQRLLALVLAPPPPPSEPPAQAACATGTARTLAYGAACGGFGAVSPSRFIDAWMHFCEWSMINATPAAWTSCREPSTSIYIF